MLIYCTQAMYIRSNFHEINNPFFFKVMYKYPESTFSLEGGGVFDNVFDVKVTF